MNVKRFTARTSRDALALVRQAFGDDAVVMSTRPCSEGVEVLAMAPESVQQLERVGMPAAAPRPGSAAQGKPPRTSTAPLRREPALHTDVERDVEQLQMSTLSFQDYVRQRMLKRRQVELEAQADAPPVPAAPPVVAPISAARTRLLAQRDAVAGAPARAVPVLRDEVQLPQPAPAPSRAAQPQPLPLPLPAAMPVLAGPSDSAGMLGELRSMRGLIEERFGALAFMEKLQRHPRQALLAQKLLDSGFSPALIRKLAQGLVPEGDAVAWAAGVLERNLLTAERDEALEDAGGIYALVGATGVGKTTSTAKLAAAFASRHGAGNLGLITLDAYRVAAHEQLRAYGRILGVPVHTAHDRASLEDLLDLLSAKRMVLIDSAGMAQRDSRTRELLEMISHRSIHRVLVVNASAQGETIEDQLAAYAAPACRGIVLSKLDEAVKLAPALDALIRHKLKVLAVANGQRVPEDWHRLSANALVQRALRSEGAAAWRLDDGDVGLIFAGMPAAAMTGAVAAAHARA